MKKKLQDEMKNAMRDKDKLRLTTIRGILSAIQYEEMRKSKDTLSDDEILAVLRTELKKRSESLEYAEKDGRNELIDDLKKEEAIIKMFLPEQMSQEELEKVICAMKVANPAANMGEIMCQLRAQYNGKFDGKIASEVVKKILA